MGVGVMWQKKKNKSAFTGFVLGVCFTNLSHFLACFHGAPFVFFVTHPYTFTSFVHIWLFFMMKLDLQWPILSTNIFFFCNVRSQLQCSASCQFLFLIISNKSISVGLIVFSTSETFIEIECF